MAAVEPYQPVGSEPLSEDPYPQQEAESENLLQPNDDTFPAPPPPSDRTAPDSAAALCARFWWLLLLFIPAMLAAVLHFERPTRSRASLQMGGVSDIVAPTILISIDAFRYEYLSRRISDGSDAYLAPTLNKMSRAGASATGGMQPVVPTKTFPNHWSIATGLYPENHGIVGNTMYDPLTDKWFHMSENDPEWWRGSPIWQTIRQTPRTVRDANGTLVTLAENYTTACVFWPGSAVAKHAADAFWHYDSSISYNKRVARTVSLLEGTAKDLKRPAQFVTLYFERVDWAGHRYGPNSAQVNEEIKKVDKAIESLLVRLGPQASKRYNIVVVSDHGMTETSRDRSLSLLPMMEEGTVQDIVTTPMGFFLNITGPAEAVYGHLKVGLKNLTEYANVFLKENLPERWHLREGRLIPRVVTMASLGWTVQYPHQHLVSGTHNPLERTSSVKSTYGIPKGNHGFDNIYDDMQSIFVAQGPVFRNSSTVTGLRAVDVYEMLCHMFSAKPGPNNGSLDATKSSILRNV